MSFASLGLSEPILRALADRGYTEPTPIQQQAIPAVLGGGDLLGGAQTGTGKTAGFTLPLLQRLSTTQSARRGGGHAPVRALILTPTRELAAQVEESVREYGKYLDLKSMVMFGGVGFQPQVDRLRQRVDILVATPGRLLDHASQKTVDLSAVEILVLDEADRMLDMGFIRDIRRVLALLPPKRQNLLFSATFSDDIRALADGLLDHPATVEVARRNTPTELVDQRAIAAEKGVKRALLSHLVNSRQWQQVLVFTRTKHGANRLAEQLTRDGISAMAIHGNKSQGARTRALSQFKDGSLRVLVATDIAARGLDIVELPVVVNYELPNVPEDYVHRIGRTGRAGCTGLAYSLVASDEQGFLSDIEKLIRRQVVREALADFDMAAAIAAARSSGAGEEDRPPRQPQGRGRQGAGAQRGATQAPAGARVGAPAGRRAASGEPRRQDARQPEGQPAAGGQRRAADGRRTADAPRQGQGRPTARGPGGVARGRSADGNRSAAPQRGEVDGNRGFPSQRPEVDGNRAPAHHRAEPDGNRAPEPRREVNGNRAPTPRRSEVDGNRAGAGGDRRATADQAGTGRSGRIKGALSQALGVLRRLG